MEKLFLKRTVAMWSAGTRVEYVRDISDDKIIVQVQTGNPEMDEKFNRQRTLEVFKDDLVKR
jgi:hypothetical protein